TDYDTAIRYYRKAVTLSPSYLLACNNLCLASVLRGDTKGALNSCTRSLYIDKNNPVTWINLGDALLLGNHYKEAEDAFRNALRYPLSSAEKKEAEAGLYHALNNRTEKPVFLDPTLSEAIFQAYHASEEIIPQTIYPSIIPFDEQGKPVTIPIDINFGYNGRPETIYLSLNSSLLWGARAAYKAPIHNTESPAGSLQTKKEWYESFIHEPHHEPVIASIHNQLTEIQKRSGLRASYLELATTFVRSLGADLSSTELRFPVETLAESAGDCDDKSILLAALLLYHGCDTAIIEFPGHVAVGVTRAGPVRQKSRYILIETTTDLPYGTVREEWRDHDGVIIPFSRTGSFGESLFH
ncbi:MAG: tetratricopeptide repeat protein, partial [Methanospirillaceae archaeon]|nr:tetratricopeptide repeat protein [Methanospirillaceae archaeon]